MAVLAPQDWHPPRDHHPMELTPSPSPRQQRASPANDHPPTTPTSASPAGPPVQQQQQQQAPQQGYPYPLQQPQPGWSVAGQPYYPQFYQNQPPYPMHAHPHPPHPHPHPHPAHAHMPPQGPYYDHHNAQLAQWAYQQMMFNAHQMQQQQQQHSPHSPHTPQRTASASGGPVTPNEYFAQNQVFSPFPSGTPPPQSQSAQQQQQQQHNGFHPYRRPNRGGAAGGTPTDDWQRPAGGPGSTPGAPGAPAAFQPPYARGDASASSSSVNSGSSARDGSRQRTSSTQGSASGHGQNGNSNNGSARGSRPGSGQSPPPPPIGASGDRPRSRTGSNSSTASAHQHPHQRPHLHHRTASSSSANSAAAPRPSASTTSSTTSASSAGGSASPGAPSGTVSPPPSITAAAAATARQPRPSPLSQSTFTAGEKRMSRDDSDLQAMRAEQQGAGERGHHAHHGGVHGHRGIKGRLRRALSLNAAQTLTLQEEEDEDDASSTRANAGRKPVSNAGSGAAAGRASTSSMGPTSTTDAADAASTATRQTAKKRSRAASLFNPKLNASTDNISLSSTMSSASMVIRKLGSIGKLARRNSLAGITSLFKDKDKEKNKDGANGMDELDDDETPIGADAGERKKGKSSIISMRKKKSKDGAKGAAAEPSVSHAHAELDRGSDWSNAGGSAAEMSGLTPAAKLARQHTLKSNAEAAAKAKAQQEAAAAAAAASAAASASVNAGASTSKVNGVPVPAPWERSTTSGRDGSVGGGRASEDGTRIVEEDEESEDGHLYGAPHAYQQQQQPHEGWDEDEWPEEDEDEEEATIRMERTHIGGGSGSGSAGGGTEEDEETVLWAQNVRRSVERKRQPTKGILKGAEGYTQDAYLADATNTQTRNRANSENARPAQALAETPSLTHIPSSDPDQIDGLHRHSSQSSHRSSGAGGGASAPFLPPLTIDVDAFTVDSPAGSTTPSGRSSPQKGPMFNLPNASAPVLSSMLASGGGGGPGAGLTHRSATTPAKRLAFANNLSVYDTFSAQVYDRRSEPATWSRLTPALAQQIKEELNSYKMEEMEVHASSRMHTQFFI